jgi:hypothetical protein
MGAAAMVAVMVGAAAEVAATDRRINRADF